MNDDTGLATRLNRQLHDQVDDLHGAPLTLESVRGRARSIRRTRRLAVAGVAAVAVAAIVVPTALLGDATGRSDRPPEIANTPTEASEPTPRADGTFPLTLDVPEGPVPETGYLDDQQYVTPDGTYEVPGQFAQLASYDGGWVGIRFSEDSPTAVDVVVLDGELEEVSASPGGHALAVSDDGSRVAWIDMTGGGATGTLVNAPVDGDRPATPPSRPTSRSRAFSATTSWRCRGSTARAARRPTRRSPPRRGRRPASQSVSEARALARYQNVGGMSAIAGLVAGQTVYGGDSTCSEVRRTDSARGAVAYETCDHQLGAFSPDGQLPIGYASYFDDGSPTLAILDAATGDPVVELTSSRRQQDAAVVMSAAWEDPDTVVAVVEQDGEQQVLRFEADGSGHSVGRAAPGTDVDRVLPPRGPRTGSDSQTSTSVTGSEESAGRSSADAGRFLGTISAPSAATMAPLSVHSPGRGTRTRMPRPAARSSAIARSRELAATPPPISRSSTPSLAAASSALRTSTSHTASWNDAATSATGTGSPARSRASTQRATAVLSPEKEKSKRCRSRSRR